MATAFTQVSFRLRNDDGSQTAATWKAALNTNVPIKPGLTFRVRFDCSETGTTAATLTGQLQASKNNGTFQAVTASSTIVKAVTSANITDDLATTQQTSSGTFVAGLCDINDGLCAATASISQNGHTELEFCVQINAADVANNDTVQLRVVRSTSTAFGTYTASPNIQVAIALSPAAGSMAFTGQTDGLNLKLAAPASASISFTGATSSVTNRHITTLSPAAASLVLTGATSKVQEVLRPATGSIAFSAVTSKLATSLHPGSAALTLTRSTSSLGRKLSPLAASFAFSPNTPPLRMAIHPAAASIAFGPITSSLATALHPGLGALAFTGRTETLLAQIHPAAAAMSFSASTPSLQIQSAGGYHCDRIMLGVG